MVTVRRSATLDADESEPLQRALGGRRIDEALAELRTAANRPAQPTDGDRRTTLVTKLRAGSEVTSDIVAHAQEAVQFRSRLLKTIFELVGDEALATHELIEEHREAAQLLEKIAEQVNPSSAPSEPATTSPSTDYAA